MTDYYISKCVTQHGTFFIRRMEDNEVVAIISGGMSATVALAAVENLNAEFTENRLIERFDANLRDPFS